MEHLLDHGEITLYKAIIFKSSGYKFCQIKSKSEKMINLKFLGHDTNQISIKI